MNHKRVDRLYAIEKLQLKKRRREKVPPVGSCWCALRPQTWFGLPILSSTASPVAARTRVLDRISLERGLPRVIRTDRQAQ